jgi:hypothetical protein
MLSRRSIRIALSIRRSSWTDFTSEPSCSRWSALLRLLVVVELASIRLDGAVEDVDGRPEQIVEVGFEAGVGHRGDQGVEDVGDGAFDDAVFRQGLGDRLRLRKGGSRRAEAPAQSGRSGMRRVRVPQRSAQDGKARAILLRDVKAGPRPADGK